MIKLTALLLATLAAPRADGSQVKPNIVYILADDLGYGDVGCYNAASKIPTPNLDRLANAGIRFTDAHASDAVCSPTRYGLLTGRYCFRSRLKAGVLPPWGEPIIERTRLDGPRVAPPSRLRHRVYRQVAPRLDLADPRRQAAPEPRRPGQRRLHPADRRRSHGSRLRHVLRRGLAELPALLLHRKRPHGGDAIRRRADGARRLQPPRPDGARLEARGDHAGTDAAQPSATSSIRPKPTPTSPSSFTSRSPLRTTPWSPHRSSRAAARPGSTATSSRRWTGRSARCSRRCPARVWRKTRWSSSPATTVRSASRSTQVPTTDVKKYGHRSMDGLRGVKRDAWEGGHRVPFLARWPGQIPAGAVSDEIICHVDLMATCAAMLGETLPPAAGVDSYNVLPALRGQDLRQPIREATVLHSGNGKFVLRQGPWVLIDARTGDDNGERGEPGWFQQERGYVPNTCSGELYDLRTTFPSVTICTRGSPRSYSDSRRCWKSTRPRAAAPPEPPNLISSPILVSSPPTCGMMNSARAVLC